MSKTAAEWGLYPWFEEHGTKLIHPDDVSLVRGLKPYGKLFRITGTSEKGSPFTTLEYGECVIRVLPSLLKRIEVCPRAIGEAVHLHDGREAEIIGRQWHHQRAEPIYQLEIDGKKKTNRYWESDFAGED